MCIPIWDRVTERTKVAVHLSGQGYILIEIKRSTFHLIGQKVLWVSIIL